jgi:hypothetical protein
MIIIADSGTSMPGSTNPISHGLAHFLATRPAPTSRRTSNEEPVRAGAHVALEKLYPSLYAEKHSPRKRFAHYARAVVIVFGTRYSA